ncbi:xaa-Pro dipeptidase isoform X2 [Homalodisca vitripennis]|uniref:xaa-Pro dipeptidase isoform X2 n=1 Tax=Homalodisca vitripennis TaxID=197043 RepID=UPI001EEAA05D|nr:xaa-Pro dipeptidase isoform X2 [Homalodisca vitripennis]
MATSGSSKAFFTMGEHTLAVPMELFALNRRRLWDCLRTKAPRGVVILEGGRDVDLHDTDVNFVFQQESYFHWMFGVDEPDFYGALDLATGRSYLFAPQFNEDHTIYMGALPSCDELKKKYAVDVVCYVNQMKCVLKDLKPEVLLTLSGINSDSGLLAKEAVFEGISEFNVDNAMLYPEITECRVIKTSLELDVLRYVNKISSDAHKLVMNRMQPGMYEYQAEAIFQHYCYYTGGCRNMGYTCICTSGHNGSVLHYGHAAAPNNKRIQNGDMLLFDMGAKYCGYVADITCSFPASGKFTKLQAAVYNAVLAARNAVLAALKPGVNWVDMHLLANKEMLTSMKGSGILTGNIDDMMKANLGAVFQPHGLGHLMGKDVHDVGGYLSNDPVRPKLPGLRNLRTARVLRAGMVLTVEPGCYFIDTLLDTALKTPAHSRFLVPEMIEQLRGSGGVRIEDDVVITETGHENLTQVPRTIEEIEAFKENKSFT